jgi:hypothetical protein
MPVVRDSQRYGLRVSGDYFARIAMIGRGVTNEICVTTPSFEVLP